MELNRNHYFMIGLIVLFLGIQFRYVESFTLTPKVTRFLAEQFHQPQASATNPLAGLFNVAQVAPRRTVVPPKWLGWAMVSTGGILILQSLAMRKPGG